MDFFKRLVSGIKVRFMKSMSDRRKYPRVPISVKVTNRSNGGGFAYYQASNISSGGMYLKSEQPLPKGTKLELAFSLPGMKDASATALVVRTRKGGPDSPYPSGMGVKFTEMNGETKEAVNTFVNMKT